MLYDTRKRYTNELCFLYMQTCSFLYTGNYSLEFVQLIHHPKHGGNIIWSKFCKCVFVGCHNVNMLYIFEGSKWASEFERMLFNITYIKYKIVQNGVYRSKNVKSVQWSFERNCKNSWKRCNAAENIISKNLILQILNAFLCRTKCVATLYMIKRIKSLILIQTFKKKRSNHHFFVFSNFISFKLLRLCLCIYFF